MDKKEILEILKRMKQSNVKLFSREYVINILTYLYEEEEKADAQPVTQPVEQPTVSLYDYLGEAANKELGGKVYRTAKALMEPVGRRYISNKKYTGEVTLYRRTFLDEYFRY